MRAVGLTRTGGPEVLEVLDLPEPEAADALVIETAAAAVNPVDLATRSGLIPTSLPAVLGWDLAGTVAHAPAGCGFRTGDRVLAMTAQLGTGVGSMAEYVAFDPGFVAPVPDGMKLEEAAALPLAGVTATQLLRRTPGRAGQRILLIGAQGGVGAHLAARLLDEPSTRTDLLVRPADLPAWQERRAGRPGEGAVLTDPAQVETGAYDIVIDAGGVPALFDAVRPQGAFLTITPFSAPDPAARPEVACTLIGVELDRDDLVSVAEAAARGIAPRQELTVLPFEDAAEAHRRLERGGFRGKLLLVP
ncbi:NADPH2:quinone reductase [Streptomyces sp. SAI-135]|jgi:NADPH:quinone reductase-like Zn-dependent oxidoreductase|uniref:NADP-dependent oxidoreductase n=1 Tax=unclassified Streptomyces TaxID=2593676 RepID=UPI002473CA01|nr:MULTISPECIES: NADP-dependent oxidoreductase [unclassified Streptomyces]MDH6515718.1 NADPH2:quinone reductase [Streptomyces sp. SAI-090]MDH6620197.1 NADPH2:quinone reductase [Streptomyces sp. SAI-135]